MNRALHKKLFQKFLYERGVLSNLCDAISSGANDEVDMGEVDQALRREEAWSQHLAFYDMLKGNYNTIRDFRDSRGRIEERKAEVPQTSRKSGRPSNVIALTRDVQKDLDRMTVVDGDEDLSDGLDSIPIDTIPVVNVAIHQQRPSASQDLDARISGLQHDQIQKAIHTKPTRYVLDHMKDLSVGGEEKNILSVLYGVLGGVNIMFISPSGSGKTVILDACLSLFPEDQIYRMISSTNAAEVRNFEEMNRAKIGYILEAKNYLSGGSENDHYKMILCLGEGRDYTKRAMGNGNDPATGERKIDHLVLKANKSFVTADAIESYLEINEEMRRRFVELMTDTSDEHRKDIIKVVARKMSGLGDKSRILAEEEESTLKSHIEEALALQGITIVNPFYESISDMIPSSAMRSNSYTKSLFKMISGSALLQHKDRIIHDGKLYVELQDVYNVMEVYFEQMCKSLVGYPVFGDDIMRVINEHVQKDQSETYSDVGEVYFTADDVYEKVRQIDGYSRINIKTVEAILDELYTCKCLEKRKEDIRAKNPAYTLAIDSPFIDLSYDWVAGLANAYEQMEAENPKLAELWLGKQVKDEQVAVYNPVSGNQVSLFNTTVFLGNTTGTDSVTDDPLANNSVINNNTNPGDSNEN